MKKAIVFGLTVAAVCSCCKCAAIAKAADSAEVYVTISDKNGKIAVAQEKICVTDINNDGRLTLDDALYLTHESAYNGGADKGYKSSKTEYGTSLEMLWGAENGSGFGYYLNSKSALSLDDEVKNGDFVDAFIYTDTESFSDTYTFFENRIIESEIDEKFDLKLFSAGFDENWQPITSPVPNVVIMIDGVETEYHTNENGVAEIAVKNSEKHIISAKSDEKIIVAPICTVDSVQADVTEALTTQSTAETSEKSANTGDCRNRILIASVIGMISSVAITTTKKKKNE